MVNRIIGRFGRAGLTAAAVVDAAKPRVSRHRAAAAAHPRPTSGALAPPVPEVFETTAPSHDGTTARVFATTSPGNQVSGARTPHQPHGGQPAKDASHSAAEGSGHPGHPAHQASRPITWVVVAFIVAGFVVAGMGLIESQPWVFWAGAIAVGVGAVAGWIFNIMGDKNSRRTAVSAKAGADQRPKSSG